MRYFLIAGERSGDLHGSYLINAIKMKDSNAFIIGYGGDQMESAGMKLLSHYKDGAFMGFIEVLMNLRSIFSRINKCKNEIHEVNPDVVILIDYPGFNLRIAKYAHMLGIRTSYYISPKIWAWKKSRIKIIRKYVDQMLVIFPFEVPFYKSLGYDVSYVGNPLVEQISNYTASSFGEVDHHSFEKRIAFLPGSREQEVRVSLPMILQLAQKHPDWMIVVAAVNNLDAQLYTSVRGIENIKLVYNQTYDVLKGSDAAVVTSGTATLETALIGTPQVICYRANPISYAIGKRVVKIKYISLVNLIADQPIVKELIQDDYNIENLLRELERLLSNKEYQRKMIDGYDFVSQLLGDQNASKNAADEIFKLAEG
jgi:lipid-A-disaccharide synthase